MNVKILVGGLGLMGLLALFAAAQDPPRTAPSRTASQPATAASHPATRPATGLTEARINELLARVKSDDPAQHERLIGLQKNNPDSFRRWMQGMDRLYRELDALPPEMRPVFLQLRDDQVKVASLMRRLKAAKEEKDKAAIRKDLREAVARQFDNTQKMKEYEVRQITQRLEDLKSGLKERSARRDALIQTRIDDLVAGRENRAW